ncbi:MAG: ATP-binding protein [Coriobacteriales bacterium]
MAYMPRMADELLSFKLEAFGATLIVGPKGCGKTTTAKQQARSIIELQDEDKREGYLAVASLQPSRLLAGENPRLIDEWQDAPKLWGAVRKSVDDRQETGLYILTGSSSQMPSTPHTGTMRISRMEMLPMSLFESGESSGQVSLKALFDDPGAYDGCESPLSVDALIFAICRGGWPRAIRNKSPRAQLALPRDLFVQTCEVDISNIDGVARNPRWAEAILRSYARNICTLAETKTVKADAQAATQMGDTSFFDYVAALEKLFIVSDVEAWCPAIRSKAAIRASRKRNLIDPSIAVAALGLSPEYFNTDFKTLGFLFESLCFRDLKAYSAAWGGRASYYRDRYGLEADCVLHLEDGRYALIEVKLGEGEVGEASRHLCEIEHLVEKANEKERQCPIPLPTFKMVLTATQYGYRRDDGVLVVPIGCLRD